jgi:hypothetical protein
MTPLYEIDYHHVFSQKSFVNLGDFEPGLYEIKYLDNPIVLSIDRFGEVRISNKTPVNNLPRLGFFLQKHG